MLEKKIIDTIEKLRITSQNMPKVWDGRSAILEMKAAGSRQWRQMEWMGFYFEFLCQTHFEGIINMPGKKYGNKEFDAFREISWDFKVDSTDTATHSVIANDAEAISDTISDYGSYGMILAIGAMEYDDKKTNFKKWHDELREQIGKYETNRINRGAMSRTRGTAFALEKIHFICFDSEMLHQCCGLLQNYFGETDINKLKRKEVIIDPDEIPDSALIATEGF